MNVINVIWAHLLVGRCVLMCIMMLNIYYDHKGELFGD